MHVFLAKIIRICFWRRTKYSLKEKENREFFQKILSENLNSFLIIKFILGLGNVYSSHGQSAAFLPQWPSDQHFAALLRPSVWKICNHGWQYPCHKQMSSSCRGMSDSMK